MDARDLLRSQHTIVHSQAVSGLKSKVFPSIVAIHNAEDLGEAMTVRSLGGFGLGV